MKSYNSLYECLKSETYWSRELIIQYVNTVDSTDNGIIGKGHILIEWTEKTIVVYVVGTEVYRESRGTEIMMTQDEFDIECELLWDVYDTF